MSSTVELAKPSKPWKPSIKERSLDIALLIGSIVTSYTVVGATEMKGKLAYFFCFLCSFGDL